LELPVEGILVTLRVVYGECTDGSLVGGYYDSGEELIVLLDVLFLGLHL